MYRFRVLITISLSLAWLAICVLVIATWLDLIPDTRGAQQAVRARTAEMLAAHVSTLLSQNDLVQLRTFLGNFQKHNPELLSIGLRSANGLLSQSVGDHRSLWDATAAENKTLDQVTVPMFSRGQIWGKLELRFMIASHNTWPQYLKDNHLDLLLCVFAMVGPLYYVYLKRILRQLDPSAVIPERVQATLDTLTEGLLILDDREYIVFANATFAQKANKPARQLLGLKIQELNWELPDNDAPRFPWRTVLQRGSLEHGHPVSLRLPSGQKILMHMNGAPVTDTRENIRGAILTFDDVTELEAKNTALAQTVNELEKSRLSIARQNEQLEILATRDALSGCYNRRAFYEKFEQLFVQAQANHTPIACIMCDLDHFKSINDTYGHAVGDQVIQAFAEVLQTSTRSEDVVGRYGGEEFCVALPGLDLAAAQDVGERVRAGIEASGYRYTPGRKVTGSFGVTTLGFGAASPAELSEEADKALYVAKANGRNRVVAWNAEVAAQAAALEAQKKAAKLIAQPSATEPGPAISALQTRINQLETQLHEQSQSLFAQAFIDTSTGLPNRRQLLDRLGHEIQHSARNGTAVAVLVAASDLIAKINSVHGTAAGDGLIRDLAARLGQRFRASDALITFRNFDISGNVYRFDNYELAIILTDLQMIDDTTWLVKRLFEALKEPINVGDAPVFPSLNVGISLYPLDGETPEKLLSRANLALDHARSLGPNAYAFYAQEINQQAIQQLQYETWMHQALLTDGFRVHYQPKIRLPDDTLDGFEALLRWHHPTGGEIPPKQFIHTAEKSGQILKLGEWALDAVCRQLVEWREQGLPETSIAVNLSILQILSPTFLPMLDAALQRHQLPARLLEFEVTESVFVDNLDEASLCLQVLRDRHHKIHIDDFGTGYSAFAYVKRLPADALKLDHSFIHEIVAEPKDQKIVQAIIALAHDLGIRCIAEGVETPEQLALLRRLNCDTVQGYLLSHPLSSDEATAYLRTAHTHRPAARRLMTWFSREQRRRAG